MTLRPIIFDADSVRAILAGRKTQTRRVVKPQSRIRPHPNGQPLTDAGWLPSLDNPYGQSGDRLWVKEPWESWVNTGRANGEAVDMMRLWRLWRSPIFMPRACARMLLEIVAVRVERVQEITEADCIAEGIASHFRGVAISGLHREYAARWNRLYAKRGYPWASNPWVFAIEFRPITPTAADAAGD